MKNLVSRKALPLGLLLTATVVFAEEMSMPDVSQATQQEAPVRSSEPTEPMWQEIHKAIMLKSDAMLKRLVEEGADVNQEGPNKITPAHLAVKYCRPAVLSYLIKKGARVEAITEREGMTPMHSLVYAEDCSDVELELMIDMLMRAQAQLDAKCAHGETPLYFAVKEEDDALVQAFLERGAAPDTILGDVTTLLHFAANEGYNDFVVMVLKMKPELVNSMSPEQTTLLMMAIMSNQEETVGLLLEHKALVDIQDKYGETALHYAALLNRPEIMSMLVACESCINAPGIYNFTPLHYAAMYNGVEVIKMLAEKGASLEMQDAMGRTPLHIAALNGSLEAVSVLLELGALRDARDNAGNTALDLMTISSCRTGRRSADERMKHRELMYELSLDIQTYSTEQDMLEKENSL